jgi:nitroimidazol reductase NimA-like FMN-containing flavoprotein (pyridoxamine 5'-phosphate oxidase superfamily)
MTMEFEESDRNQVKRIPNRGHYDRATIYKILDAGFLCHAGFVLEGQPFVIPTLYGRVDDRIYIHGSAASRMLKNLADGIPVCLTVTHVDGLVLARSAFHHSMNYRSAVLFGSAVVVSGQDKVEGLLAISDQVVKGRWEETRLPNEKELKATTVLRVDIESASAKIRTGPPSDEEADYDLPIWAGVVPIETVYHTPQPDQKLSQAIGVPQSVQHLLEGDKS